jgi:nucleoside-diphosphate-sugar epimerase
MRHVLVGYGYCATHLSSLLIEHQQKVMTLSRGKKPTTHPLIEHVSIDVQQEPVAIDAQDVIYYFIPPNKNYENDVILEKFLNHLTNIPQKIIYIGSSGVYGHQSDEWVNELTPCHVETLRQRQRKNAEEQLQIFSEKHQVPCALLRVAGIYGPARIPLDSVLSQQPVIITSEAPLMNHIYVKDLAKILFYLGKDITYHGILNVADGTPSPMGKTQQLLAELINYPKAPMISFQEAWLHASEMKKEFMTQSKKLDISFLQQILKNSTIMLTPIDQALQEILKAD